jgi:hypothetical protein
VSLWLEICRRETNLSAGPAIGDLLQGLVNHEFGDLLVRHLQDLAQHVVVVLADLGPGHATLAGVRETRIRDVSNGIVPSRGCSR